LLKDRAMTRDRIFICPSCGHTITYQPEECELLVRFKPHGQRMKEARYRIVRCAHCGEQYKIAEVPGD
jgi:hypothetical protein